MNADDQHFMCQLPELVQLEIFDKIKGSIALRLSSTESFRTPRKINTEEAQSASQDFYDAFELTFLEKVVGLNSKQITMLDSIGMKVDVSFAFGIEQTPEYRKYAHMEHDEYVETSSKDEAIVRACDAINQLVDKLHNEGLALHSSYVKPEECFD